MNELLAVAGRFHPLLLHLPIGLIAALAALEFLGALRRSPPPLTVIATLATLTQLAAAAAIASGLLLEQEGGYPEALADQHRNFALGFFVVCVFIGRLARHEHRRTQLRVAVLVALGLIGAAGHLGGSITHGDDFLFAPLERSASSAPDASAPAQEPAPPLAVASFESHVAPILAASCIECHGAKKRKGRLELHTREGLERGGSNGAVLVPGDVAASSLIQRLHLPLDDDEHMPPADKPQPTALEVALLEAWIEAGAPFEASFALPPGWSEAAERSMTSDPEPALDEVPSQPAAPEPPHAVGAAPSEAIEALRARLAHVQPLAQDDALLWIDFAAPAAEIDDAAARELLEPLAAYVAELSLARTRAGDAALATVARMARLRRLDLRASATTSKGLEALRELSQLRELNVAQTAVDDAALDTLAALPALERLIAWEAGFTPEGLERLRAARPELSIEGGADPDARALESEGEVVFSSDAPLPGQESSASGLTPVNSKCPVSSSPVNPKYSVVFEGRVIGFCCPNCPKEFWADPDAFREKLE